MRISDWSSDVCSSDLRIVGLAEQQGVAWLPAEHELVVAFGDGSVHFYGTDLRELARIDLGHDADNVRVDPRNAHVLVGYGQSRLAPLDAAIGPTLSFPSTFCVSAYLFLFLFPFFLFFCSVSFLFFSSFFFILLVLTSFFSP